LSYLNDRLRLDESESRRNSDALPGSDPAEPLVAGDALVDGVRKVTTETEPVAE